MTGVVSTLGSPPRATRSLGTILVDSGQLTADEAERVLVYQRAHGLRFGEAAVRLGLISEAEVQFALSRQFSYAYLRKIPGESRGLSDEIVAAIRANNVPVDYVVFPDEGHGFLRKQNRVDASEAYLRFLNQHLRR